MKCVFLGKSFFFFPVIVIYQYESPCIARNFICMLIFNDTNWNDVLVLIDYLLHINNVCRILELNEFLLDSSFFALQRNKYLCREKVIFLNLRFMPLLTTSPIESLCIFETSQSRELFLSLNNCTHKIARDKKNYRFAID